VEGGDTHMSSWGGLVSFPCFLRRCRNRVYDFKTSGIPFEGSNRAIWMKYLPVESALETLGNDDPPYLQGISMES
jgi:hypothetical protein